MLNVNFELSSVTDWIVVSLTALGVLIALIGLIFAIITVNNWKKEKKWDVIMEALENVNKTEEYYKYLLQSFKSSYEYTEFQQLTTDVKDNFRYDPRHNLKIETDEDIRFLNFDNNIFLINEKLKHIFPNKENSLKEFYKLISIKIFNRRNKITELENKLYILKEARNSNRDSLVKSAKELVENLSIEEVGFKESLDKVITALKNKTIESFL